MVIRVSIRGHDKTGSPQNAHDKQRKQKSKRRSSNPIHVYVGSSQDFLFSPLIPITNSL
jgi:hypothetical protein